MLVTFIRVRDIERESAGRKSFDCYSFLRPSEHIVQMVFFVQEAIFLHHVNILYGGHFSEAIFSLVSCECSLSFFAELHANDLCFTLVLTLYFYIPNSFHSNCR